MSEDGEARFRRPKTIYEELESFEKRLFPRLPNIRINCVAGLAYGKSTRLPPLWPAFKYVIVGLDVICGLSLLVLYPVLRGTPVFLGFSPLIKNPPTIDLI